MAGLVIVAAATGAVAQPGAPQTVDTVTVAGNQAVSTASIVAVVTTRPGMSLTGPGQVKADIDHIVALYRDRGLDLSISPDIGHPAPGHLTLRYAIDETGHGGDAGAALPPGAPPAPQARVRR